MCYLYPSLSRIVLTIILTTLRSYGARGKVKVPYYTSDGTAKAGKDFEPTTGLTV